MLMFIIQSLLLMAIAYILGCILGCLFHRLFGGAPEVAAAAPIAAAAAAVAMPKTPAAPTPPKAPPPPAPAPLVTKPKPAPAPVVAKRKAAPAPIAEKQKPAPAKVAAVSKPASKPATKPKPKPKYTAANKDNLKRIRGIGPQNEARLNMENVFAFQQIADWSAKDQAFWGDKLAFPGRIEREEWVKQAKVLAKGGNTQFSKRVDKGDVDSSIGKASAAMGKKPSTLSKPRAGGADNLTLIDGVGNALEKKLFGIGIYHFDQIAKWDKENQIWAGNMLGFPGRPERENWVGESKILAAGGTTKHAQRVERGEITTSRKSKPS